jgi:hypothetical protein
MVVIVLRIRLPNIIEPIGVPDRTRNASLFYAELERLKDENCFLKTR